MLANHHTFGWMIRRPPSWPQPQVLDSVKSLKWYAQTIADRVQSGMHTSRRLAVGMEFDQYRQYTPGDDLRLLDWKKYARTGKYYLRQSVQENIQHLSIHLDTSRSMQYGEDGVTKLDCAKVITACMSLVLINQGDGCSWAGVDDQFPMGMGKLHWHRMTDALYALDVNEGSSGYTHLAMEAIWLSDLYDTIPNIETWIKEAVSSQAKLSIVHIIGRKEEALDFSGNLAFVDLETKERVVLSAASYREKYASALAEHYHKISQLCYRYGVQYHKVYLQDEIADTVRHILNQT